VSILGKSSEAAAPRPSSVTLIATVFLLAAGYLLGTGLTLFLRPGTLAMASGSDLLAGLETAGPLMFLLGAVVYGATGLGLWKLHPLARHAAIVIAAYGAVMAVPAISSAVISLRLEALLRPALPFLIRMLVIFFLWQQPTAEAFRR
jgi:hypothetical protein